VFVRLRRLVMVADTFALSINFTENQRVRFDVTLKRIA
jgi:hypothetical protein